MVPHPLEWVNKNDNFLSNDPTASCGLPLDIRSNVIYIDMRQIVCEYDFSNLRDSITPSIRSFKKFMYFFIIFLIIISLLVLITADHLRYDMLIFPIYTVLVIGFLKWLVARWIYKIHITDSELTMELDKESIKIPWRDIEHIYVKRKWGGTKLRIKPSNVNIKLPRKAFYFMLGTFSDEGEKLLVRALKKISVHTELKSNNNIKNIIKFWNKYDVRDVP